MATIKTFPINPGTNLYNLMQATALNLSQQGFDSDLQMLNPQSGMLTVRKDYDDIKKLLGLGYQSKVTFTVLNGNQLNISIDSDWTYVLLALLIGCFVIFIPLITGAIGAVGLYGLPDKIESAVTSALAQTQGAAYAGQPYHQRYQQPQQQYHQPNQQQFQQQFYQQQQFQQQHQQFQQQQVQQQVQQDIQQQIQQDIQQQVQQPPMGS